MAHQRKLIRDAVVARLVADIPSLASKIYPNRIRPLYQDKLPCILVYTTKEQIEVFQESPREYRRELQVVIEVIAKADSSIDDTLDAICETVENSIFREETFGGLASDTLLLDTDISLIAEGEKLMGAAQITLGVRYYSILPADLTGDLEDLETIHTDIDVGADDQVEAQDDFDLTEE